MASVFKRVRKVVDPKTGATRNVQSAKWHGRYRDEHGVQRRVPLCRDKTAAQTMLNELVMKAERRAAGITAPWEDHVAVPLVEHPRAFGNALVRL